MILPAFKTRLANHAEHFRVIAAFFDENRRVPSYRELTRMFGYASTNASFLAVRRLIADGAIIKRPVPGGGFVLVPAGRRVSNKRGKIGVGEVKRPKRGKSKSSKQPSNKRPTDSTV